MTQQQNILSLSESMELTMDKGNFSNLTEWGEFALDAVLNEGLMRDVPILGTIVGAGKCIRNVSDILFAKKLIAFFSGLSDTNARDRKEAITKWESDAKYRIRVGETLLNMVHRCDDTQKARWLSQLFCELVLKKGWGDMFMRAEKVLSGMSVMDVMAFLELPKKDYSCMTIEDGERFFHSGLYVSKGGGLEVDDEGTATIEPDKLHITEVGMLIYEILNNQYDS